MAVTKVVLGFGSILKRGDGGGPENFSTIAENLDISIDTGELQTIDATHQESPDSTEELIAGLHSTGSLTFSSNYIPSDAEQTGLLTDKTNRVKRNFKVTVPTTPTGEITFTALVTNFNIGLPVKDKMSVDTTLKMTGAVTIT